MKKRQKAQLHPPITDDLQERLSRLVFHRLPWLFLGLAGAFFTSVLIKNFEVVLSKNISIAFFVPAIVYMSSAVGTQTEIIFVRSISQKKISFFQYLWREMLLGLILGIVLGTLFGLISLFWLRSAEVATTVGIAMAINIFLAPMISVFIPELFFKRHSDPAIGAGPVTTIVLDALSLLVYMMVATMIIF